MILTQFAFVRAVLPLLVRMAKSAAVRWLIDRNANLNMADNIGWTAAMSMRAARNGRVEVLQLLAADAGADLAIRSNNGQTALIYAAAKNQSAAVRWLIDRNANMTDNDTSCSTSTLPINEKERKVRRELNNR